MADVQLRPDIQTARDRMSQRAGSGREIKKLAEYLWGGERVSHLASGSYGGGMGLVVLTDRRMLFLKDGWTSQTTENFPFDKISSVQWSGGMMMGKVIIFASGNKAEIAQVPKADGKAVVDAVNNIIAGAPSAAAQPVQVPPQQAPVDPLAQVPSFELVKALRTRGVLGDQEFAAIAARL